MRRWVVLLAVLIVAGLAWMLRDDARGVAASREAVAQPSDERERSGPSELVAPEAAQIARPGDRARRTAELDVARAPDSEDLEESEEPPPNLLEVRVVAADGRPWVNGTLRILAETSPVLRRFQPLFPPDADGADAQPWMSRFQMYERSTEEGVYCSYRSDEEGRARIAGVTPEQPFRLLAVDGLGEIGGERDEPPMAPGEVRQVELFLTRPAAPLSGTCVAEDGAPADDVALQVRGARGSLSRTSDLHGAFATGPLFAERVTLFAEHDAHGTAQLLDVEPAAGPFELRLRGTRTLRVRLVDQRGARSPLTGLQLNSPANSYGALNPTAPDDVHVFHDVPREPATLVLDQPRPGRSLAIDAECESVTWTVPEVGVLEVRAERITGPDGDFLLQVRDAEDNEASRMHLTLTNTGTQVVRAQLWEGEHWLQVLHVPDEEPKRAVAWGAPFPVTIRGNETTHATVGP